MASVVRSREEESERLSEEVSENRDDLDRMLASFRHRERQLLDDVDALTHKNSTLTDLVDLVTERAESTQKELDRCRTAGSGDVTATPSADVAAPLLQKEWEVSLNRGRATRKQSRSHRYSNNRKMAARK